MMDANWVTSKTNLTNALPKGSFLFGGVFISSQFLQNLWIFWPFEIWGVRKFYSTYAIHTRLDLRWFELCTTFPPLNFQHKQKVPHSGSVWHSLLSTSNVSRRCPAHEPTSTDSDLKSSVQSVGKLYESKRSCQLRQVYYCGLWFFLRERNIGNFFIIRFLQSLCRSRTEWESHGGRVVCGEPYLDMPM